MAELKVFDDLDALARAAAEEIAKSAQEAIAERGRFTIALSGGSTPKPVYRLLAHAPRIDWRRVHVFWGDERHVPPDHAESNFGMAHGELLSKIPIPPENVHRMRAENPNVERAADEYAWTLRSAFNLEEGELPRFDLVLMGIGDDGHTASLFPGSDAVREQSRLVIAPWVEKLGAHRITLTPPVFNHARLALFLVSGEEKADALKSILEGGFEPDLHPAQIVKPGEGRLVWMVDRAAASRLLGG